MEEEVVLDSTSLSEYLPVLAEAVTRKVEDCKANLKICGDLNEFLNLKNVNGIRQLFNIVSVYAEIMGKLGVQRRRQLEELWVRRYREAALRDNVERLLRAEESMDDFVQEIDKQLAKEEALAVNINPPRVGDHLPADLILTEVPSGQSIPLGETWKGSKFTLFVLMRHYG